MTLLLADFNHEVQPVLDDFLQEVVNDPRLAVYRGLTEMLTYHMGWQGDHAGGEAQGKRVRPLFLFLTCQAVGGDWRQAVPAAAAVEILHNFSLIHDDIEDQGELRRGRPTLWKIWGEALAINAGDAMYSLAFQALSRLSETCPADICLQANRIMVEACLNLTGGQHLDIANEKNSAITLREYWTTVGGKTAALIATCGRLGALIGGASRDQVDAFGTFGQSFGLSFQAQDDWLGMWGAPENTGKSNASDLASGKKSLPVVYALARDGAFARRWLAGPLSSDEIPYYVQLLRDEGAQQYTEDKAAEYTQKALLALESTHCRDDATQALKVLTQSLLGRKQ